MLQSFTCRHTYSVFARNQRFGVAFITPNEYCCLAFGSRFNTVSRNTGQAWSEVFGACESTVWKEFFFEQQNNWGGWWW